ncbi:TonB-dependent receptor plug domain-containing protein [Occallatibacter savannae]|uniref:TonB-dependent receptor plug domain-containing protein n=1 Tax=Occallatibacter savannae TaxID=1002691 RepID=UPI000D688881|nr:TonB-dependent receptor [Occallatibacter savannae]
MIKSVITSIAAIVVLGCCSQSNAQNGALPDLSALNLEQLTRIEVNTASRRDQSLFETPAAVYVITHEELMRSGATSVPEALRMVPGIEVAQIDANKWAVSARGFNSRFANKMLIMIDGRSIYNPVYSGTLWDQNDLLIEDIDRIEIVRGPGATMWGANAVNGVINIVTSKPRASDRTLSVLHGGNIDEVASERVSFASSNLVRSRIYARYVRHRDLLSIDNASAGDGGTSERIGGRLDWHASNRDQLTFQANLFRNPEQQRICFGYSPSEFTYSKIYGAGGFAMGKWERKFGTSDLALQGYFTDEHRNEIGMKLDMRVADIDFQHHINTGSGNDIVWGTGFRWTSDKVLGQQAYFTHSDHLVSLFSAFMQDSYPLLPAKLTLTAGSKVQWNSYTNFEWQPRVSLIWTPDSTQALWGAMSRAVRTPSDQDRDVQFLYPMGEADAMPLFGLISGNPGLKSEIVIAEEVGYRRRFAKWFSADLAGFLNRYSDLQATYLGEPYLLPGPPAGLVQPFEYVNGFSAHAQGVEASIGWTPVASVRVLGSYAWMQARLHKHGDVMVQPSGGQDWSTPRNTFDVRAHWSATRTWSINAALNGNSTVPSSLNIPIAVVAGHTRFDMRVTHSFGEGLEFAVGGTNLLRSSHQEFYPEDYTLNAFVPRGLYLSLNWAR